MLNRLQKEMLEASIDFLIDSIKDCEEVELALKAIDAITDVAVFNDHTQQLEQADILDSVEQLRRILQHPHPQNRMTGSPYVGQDPGMAVWKDPITHAIKKEPLGILSLTTQNNNECAPVTKQDVVEHIDVILNRCKVTLQARRLQQLEAQQPVPPVDTQPQPAQDAPTGQFFAQTAADLYQQAQQLLQQRKFDEALSYMDAAINKEPQNAEYRFQRGKALIKAGRRADGLADFNQAVHLRPQHAQTWVERGFTRENLGDILGALQDYDRALQINPQQYFALSRRGGLRMQLGQVAQGEQDFVQALGIKADDASIYVWRGEQYLGLERYADALQDFNDAHRLQPTWRDVQALKAETEKLIANPATANHFDADATNPPAERSSNCLVM